MPTNVVFIINMPSVNIEIEWVNRATYVTERPMSLPKSPSLMQQCLQCFDTVGWAAGRASGLQKYGGRWRWALVGLDGVAPSRIVCASASVNLPLHQRVQKFSSGTSWKGWSRKDGHKTVVVVLVMQQLSLWQSYTGVKKLTNVKTCHTCWKPFTRTTEKNSCQQLKMTWLLHTQMDHH